VRASGIILFALFYPFAILLMRNAVLVKAFPKLFERQLAGLWALGPPALYCFRPPLLAFWFLPLKHDELDEDWKAMATIGISVLYLLIMVYPVALFGWASYCGFAARCDCP
jgi:hypothetical protein